MGISVFPQVSGTSPKLDVFTSSGSWVCPSNVTVIDILAVAGGGGGGAAESGLVHCAVSGGGGGGQVIRKNLSVTPGTTYTVTIGAGGLGSTSSTSAGASGAATTFAAGATILLSALGGGGAGSIKTVGGTATYYYNTDFVWNGPGAQYSLDVNISPNYNPMSGSGGADGNYWALTQDNSFLDLRRNGVANMYGADLTQVLDSDLNILNPVAYYSATAGCKPGKYGFGGSGGGAIAPSDGGVDFTEWNKIRVSVDGGGAPVSGVYATVANGNNAVANTGGGGSGGAAAISGTSVANGGNGGSGRIEIGYSS